MPNALTSDDRAVTGVLLRYSPPRMWSARSTCLRAPNFRPIARKGAWRSLHTTHGTSAGGTKDPNVYCRDFVRTHDYESYLISQFYPKEKRNGYFALKAFYVREVRALWALACI